MALNPIAFTETLVRSFLRYQLTTYPFADEGLHGQMRRLLSLDETRRTPLLKGPYVSLSRPFREGASVEALVKEGVFHPGLQGIAQFPALYGHQERAIRAIQAGRTTLVSTGTGSGKTEAFLYPIISRCLQLRDDNSPSGIAAVLVYPMNALAEDQLGRLRELLAGSGVPFGMYVGKTPENEADVAGQRLRPGTSREDYRHALKKAQDEHRVSAVHPAEERCSREEMRTPGKQPRILLTNVKQLELLLTRQSDEHLFDSARLDFLVFDEAHTFGGAVGAETACLIRRLRAFCGRDASETTCVATSATIADPERGSEAGREFAARFFGVLPEGVELVGEEYEADVWAEVRLPPPAAPSDPLRDLTEVLRGVDAGDGGGEALSRVVERMTLRPLPSEAWSEDLFAQLRESELVYRISAALDRPRPLSDLLSDLEKALGRAVAPEEALAWLALGAAARKEGRPLLRPVVHAFVTGVSGAVVTFPPAQGPRLWLSAEDAAGEAGTRARLEIETCTTCGQHYFIHYVADFSFTERSPGGGEAIGERRIWRSLDRNLGGHRVVLVDRVIGAQDDDEDPPRTAPVFLCRACGTLHPDGVERCDACGEAGPVRLLAVGQKAEHPGYLTRCLSCGSPGRTRGGGYREPARPVRATTVSDVHVLAQDMVGQAERRRLLVFADNRQDAAFQAGWMRDHARRFRLRALIVERLNEGPVSVGDLAAYLDARLDADDDLSRSIAPEVWQVETKEAAPLQHAQERKHFLRIHVLREVTTGVKQRLGLEPWGRMRVEYAGVNADADWIKTHAGPLGFTPQVLAEGVAALLDRIRRGLNLLDRQGEIFSRFWDEGSREILRGYLPLMPGVPSGVKLERDPSDDKQRVSQWLSQRGDTSIRQAVRAWGLEGDHVAEFIRALWTFLRDAKVLVGVTLKGSRGNALPGCAGAHQIDADRLTLVSHRGFWRCRKCRRTQARPAPLDRCLSWHCGGTLEFTKEDADNYDLALLDRNVPMIRPREHSAQVPADQREILERAFKGEGELINTLVCTPTLEMGVDIGALDTILMRNVPPLPANYWQRAGRAGRRHRMAVNVTYARSASHDRVYFADPMRMLTGLIEPPRFNMRNELMVRKHVHAAVLTRLGQLKRPDQGLSEFDREEIATTLDAVFPRQIRHYLFDDTGHVRSSIYDVAPLRTLTSKHNADLLRHVTSAFTQGWPEADRAVVASGFLQAYVDQMADQLEQVVRSLRKRLDWALDQMRRLDDIRHKKGTLEPDEDSLYARCDRLVKRYKGQHRRQRREAEGVDDIATFNVLAAEGFLPGYGLEAGGVTGTAQMPRAVPGLTDFDLGRPAGMAVREFVPGNLIYANNHRFTPRHYHFSGELAEPVAFQVDVPSQSVSELGTGAAALGAAALRAVPICDVDLVHMSHISDEEENRFQLPVAMFGYEQGRHGGGRGFRWGSRDVLLRRGVHLRLVNVGAVSLVEKVRLGYDVCLVCGQSRSPFASLRERDKFAKDHRERCGQAVTPTGFFADVVADALSLPGCTSRDEAFSVLEALRMGASRILDMERDDLEILVIGQAGSEEVTGLLYDPMPGGSGLLDQISSRFSEVAAAAREALEGCASACERSCIDCLLNFRNAFFHKFLNRKLAAQRIAEWGPTLEVTHEIPAKLPVQAPSGDKVPTNEAESRLRQLLLAAGFPEPEWQKPIELGKPLGTTRPDCFFPSDDPAEAGVCLYLDGLSEHIHGNALTAAKDREIREELRAREYVVLEIAATELWDRNAMARHFFRLGKEILGRDRARVLRDSPSWFPAEAAAPESRSSGPAALPFEEVEGLPESRFKSCIPLMSLKAAAGAFGDGQIVEAETWVRPQGTRKLRQGMFVAQVIGKSMEPTIPDGAYCLFSSPVEGTRNGRVVLVQHRDIADPETGGTYTVKRYSSEKAAGGEAPWRHTTIVLKPDNPEFTEIVLSPESEEDVKVVAELVDVLSPASSR
jgi:SOS-response transcriptional repressor LexA